MTANNTLVLKSSETMTWDHLSREFDSYRKTGGTLLWPAFVHQTMLTHIMATEAKVEKLREATRKGEELCQSLGVVMIERDTLRAENARLQSQLHDIQEALGPDTPSAKEGSAYSIAEDVHTLKMEKWRLGDERDTAVQFIKGLSEKNEELTKALEEARTESSHHKLMADALELAERGCKKFLSEAQAENESLRQQTRWIPVSERMPTKEDGDEDGTVLFRFPRGMIMQTVFNHEHVSKLATHWMTAPPIPTSTEGEEKPLARRKEEALRWLFTSSVANPMPCKQAREEVIKRWGKDVDAALQDEYTQEMRESIQSPEPAPFDPKTASEAELWARTKVCVSADWVPADIERGMRSTPTQPDCQPDKVEEKLVCWDCAADGLLNSTIKYTHKPKGGKCAFCGKTVITDRIAVPKAQPSAPQQPEPAWRSRFQKGDRVLHVPSGKVRTVEAVYHDPLLHWNGYRLDGDENGVYLDEVIEPYTEPAQQPDERVVVNIKPVTDEEFEAAQVIIARFMFEHPELKELIMQKRMAKGIERALQQD